MAAAWYEKLSGLDEAFLAFETENAYMHIGITMVFDPGSLGRTDGGIDIRRIRSYVASRLHLVPRYRQRLARVPLTQRPVWVDDDAFDLSYHVRHIALPRPGGERQLQRRCAEILERPLDRSRPLWEFWFIEGLAGGRFALLGKVHHCMVDGIAGVALIAALLGLEPSTSIDPPQRWRPRPAPSDRELMARESAKLVRRSLGLARGAFGALREPVEAQGRLRGGAGALLGLLRDGLRPAPATPFNLPIGPHRRVGWFSFSISDVKAIRERIGGTLNDVVLTVVAGALHEVLLEKGAAPGALRAVVPVNVRTPGEGGALGNRVSIWLVSLPVDRRDPLARFRAVSAATAELKANDGKRGAEVLAEAADWTSSELLELAARLFEKARSYNLVVTNVPGPPVELHLLDAPLVAAYPHLPLFENQGLSVALFSYDGRLFWGLTADWNHGPDLARLKHAVHVAFEELRLAAGVPPRGERRNGRARLGAIAPVKLSVVPGGAPADRRGR